LFKPESKQYFLYLSADRALVAQEKILGKLLGDGGAA